jgi:hypothetical protein
VFGLIDWLSVPTIAMHWFINGYKKISAMGLKGGDF